MIFCRCSNGLGFKIKYKFLLSIFSLIFALLFSLTPLIESEAVASQSEQISMIADLLTDRNGDGRPDRLGERVTVRGRATVATDVLNDQYLLFYMQDKTAGIMVFSDTLEISVSKGDSLKVTGTLEVHASKPEIVIEDIQVLKSTKRVPEAKPLKMAFEDPENYRGLLVSGEAIVQDRSPSENIKMLQISPATGADDSLHIFVSRANVHYEDFNFDALDTGDRIHIRGIFIRYISDYSGKTLYQIFPRSREDLTVSNLQPMVNEGSFIYADIDTTSGTIYMLLENGLWGYNLSDENWRFLDALSDLERAFSTYEFGFNAQANLIQLWSRGIGKLYSIDPQTYNIKREDQSTEHKNQFGHFPFFRDSTLYAFGGYGFWDYNNLMVQFDYSQNDWEIQTVSENSPYPSRRIPTTGTYDSMQDRLYIFGGRGTESGYPEDQNSGSQEFQDIWSFSFDSQEWEKIVSLRQLENGLTEVPYPTKIGRINKRSSSLYLPDEKLWFIPTFDPKPLHENFHLRAVRLSSQDSKGAISPEFDRSNKFLPTNYFHNPNNNEVVFVGIDNLTNANRYPVRIHRMPTDSLMAKISNPPFYLTAKLYYYLFGIAVIGGFLFWFYEKQVDDQHVEDESIENISYHSILKAGWYNSREKELLEYMHEENRFLDSHEIEELLWSDIESYDYRRRLRNDLIKGINNKFKNHYSNVDSIIIRKKDPNDNRRYLYGLNKQLIED